MLTRKLEIEIPDAIKGFLPEDDSIVQTRLRKLLLADLAQQGVISFGRAAEIVGVDKITFITEMGNMGIPYFNATASEVWHDAEIIANTTTESVE
ncbi:MAG: UPF0175 family protein [Oscillospiraceae bacterium]|nr:UPF0175 family protein [Oscillospiraceae bacterium]